MTSSEFAVEHRRLIRDLRSAGFAIDDLREWTHGSAAVSAEAILLQHLASASSDDLKEFIARAITQRGFEAAVPLLVRCFESVGGDSARWGIANAIAYLGFPRSAWDDLLRIASDARYGTGRQTIVMRLHRIKLPQTENVLLGLVNDRTVDAFAVKALGYCGAAASVPVLRSLDLATRSALLRREVPKAVRRIEERLRNFK